MIKIVSLAAKWQSLSGPRRFTKLFPTLNKSNWLAIFFEVLIVSSAAQSIYSTAKD
jgi:hypothetical protein